MNLTRYLFASLLLVASLTSAQEISVRPDRTNGIYKVGEKATLIVQVSGTNGALTSADYELKSGGLKSAAGGTLEFRNGCATVETLRNEPGWMLLEVKALAADGKGLKASGGVVFSPELIRPSLPRPDDFDKFWKTKVRELSRVPAMPKLTRGDAGKPGIEYATITMRNIRGSLIHGQVAKPAGPGKFPALLIVQWAGVYPLQKAWAVDRAAEGWLVLNILAHDLPAFEPETFYREQNSGPLKNYVAIGNDDRETSYFLRMFLSCYRGADYLADRKDWDRKHLVVTGSSQGGLQALMIAGLHPKITAALACVPAGCDLTGPDAGRAPGWPMWPNQTEGKDPARVRQASRYFDVVNFAERIKCPVLIGAGGIDITCPPPGIYAAYNQLKGPKEIVYMPLADHGGKHDMYYARFKAWLDMQRTRR
jgi:cephalosporin-C deacetylase-like acetyl esterase